LAHHLTPEALTTAYLRLRKDAAIGVDGVTVAAYGENLEANIGSLFERLKGGKYRHQPIRRVHIPKDGGKTRPLGISATEDKIVQRVLTTVLEAVYEQDFKDFSYGFRPGRKAHDALKAINRMIDGEGVRVIVEADIKGYFDNIDRGHLMTMLRNRIADEKLLHLVGKCLHVGVLEGEEYSEPEDGTAQGSIISPLLGNVYLHNVLDEWWESEVLPRMKGKAYLVRYADDFVMGFEREEDADRVMKVLHQRFERYGLELHPEKTRQVTFRPPTEGETEPGDSETFDFLGFTHYWKRTRSGNWRPWVKTRKVKLRKAIKAIADYCKRHRHEPVKEQRASLKSRMQGHFNYFGVNGNSKALEQLYLETKKVWFKWLNRRSQRSSLTWPQFLAKLKALPLPRPRIKVQLWGAGP
jgi:group II intron reverse transcriptase/maturase